MKKLYTIAFAGILFSGCGLNGPSWDVDVVAPTLETTLTASNLIGEGNVTSDPDGKLFLDMTQDVYTLEVDTLSEIEDVKSATVVSWLLGNFTIQPGTALPPQSYSLNLDLAGAQLTYASVRNGVLQLTIKSLIPAKVHFTYDIPAAEKNGIPFTFSDFIPASNGTDTVVYTKAFSIANYNLQLTGNGSQFNRINFLVTPTIDNNSSAFNVSNGQFLFLVENSLVSLQPSYIKGYFGQLDLITSSGNTEIDFMKKLVSGTIDLPEVTMDLQFYNYLGANLRIRPNQFVSYNSKTQQSVILSHPSIGNSVNVDRATYSNTYPPVTPFIEILHFDAQNSNLEAFMENLPDQVNYDFEANLNPYGNLSGNNDFFYTLFPPKIAMHIQAPLKASIQNLVFADTLDYNLTDATLLDNFLSGEFRVLVTNEMPMELGLNIYLLDDSQTIIDSLFSEDLIAAPPVAGNGVVLAPVSGILHFPISEEKITNLKQAQKILIKARILTKPGTVQPHLTLQNKLHLKIIADVKYHVDL